MLLSFTISAFLSAATLAQPFYPGEWGNWETQTPDQVGLNTQMIKKAIEYAQSMESDNPRNMEINHYQTFGREPFGIEL